MKLTKKEQEMKKIDFEDEIVTIHVKVHRRHLEDATHKILELVSKNDWMDLGT